MSEHSDFSWLAMFGVYAVIYWLLSFTRKMPDDIYYDNITGDFQDNKTRYYKYHLPLFCLIFLPLIFFLEDDLPLDFYIILACLLFSVWKGNRMNPYEIPFRNNQEHHDINYDLFDYGEEDDETKDKK